MTRNPLDRGAIALGALAVLCLGFHLHGLATGRDYSFVQVDGAGLVALLAVGVAAIGGGLAGRPVLVVFAGAGSAVAAVVSIVQLGRHTNWLHANGSTYTLFLGLAIGLLVIGSSRYAPTPVVVEER